MTRLPFLAVMERTRRGTPHLHVIARTSWIDQVWLSKQTAELLDSPIVDIRRIDSPGRVAGYAAKYVGKDPAKIGTSKRYWQSRDFDQRPKQEKWTPGPDDARFERVEKHHKIILAGYRLRGWLVWWKSRNHAIAYRPGLSPPSLAADGGSTGPPGDEAAPRYGVPACPR